MTQRLSKAGNNPGLTFVRNLLPHQSQFHLDEGLVVDDIQRTHSISETFAHHTQMGDKMVLPSQDDQWSPENFKKIVGLMEQALKCIHVKNPEFHDLFKMAIQGIFYARSNKTKGGGTSAGAFGVIWASPRTNWATADIVEFFVHELTHTLVFLDELCHKHYHSEKLQDTHCYAKSAILLRMRPMDKALHSLIVAIEILEARKTWLGDLSDPKLHPPTTALHGASLNTLASIQEVLARETVLTPRGLELLTQCEKRLAQLG